MKVSRALESRTLYEICQNTELVRSIELVRNTNLVRNNELVRNTNLVRNNELVKMPGWSELIRQGWTKI